MIVRAGAVIGSVAWLLYPAGVLFGLYLFEPRYVALMLAGSLLLRRQRETRRFLRGLSAIDLTLAGGLSLLLCAIVLSNDESLLRLYPAAMNFAMLLLFGVSLIRPPSMIERFARLAEPELAPDGVRYTRRVTIVWCAFLFGNSIVALATAFLASREVWALYNGLIAYLLMAGLFVGERCVRSRFLRKAGR